MYQMELEPGWARKWVRENATRLEEFRLERRISRNQLADESGVNVSQISRAEAGRDVRLSTMLKIYAGLGYRVELELNEICEEATDLLIDECDRRKDRRHDGLLMGKRWR
jgi:transcriptional regulator with XRE-family HTH domain